ncbi:MAG TPA: hypothetical protein VMT83_05155 [Burkholderiaceae bacterium]|nr:hypothetical protein [Burkholderiaceae bacterium]
MNGRSIDAPAEVERQMRSLLELIESDRARRCAQILDPAHAGATALRARAASDARARLRAAFAEQRQRGLDALAAARARAATRMRLRAQQHAAALLRDAWRQLPDALRASWRDARSRAAWVDQVVATARTRLSVDSWRIVHAAGWPVAEQQALERSLVGIRVSFEPDAALDAGLQIVAGGNLVDATVTGLLGDRSEIEAALLRLLEPEPGPR